VDATKAILERFADADLPVRFMAAVALRKLVYEADERVAYPAVRPGALLLRIDPCCCVPLQKPAGECLTLLLLLSCSLLFWVSGPRLQPHLFRFPCDECHEASKLRANPIPLFPPR
jgi:hypothetical protein